MLLVCIKSFAGREFVAHKGEVQGSYNFWFYDPEEEHDPRHISHYSFSFTVKVFVVQTLTE